MYWCDIYVNSYVLDYYFYTWLSYLVNEFRKAFKVYNYFLQWKS